MNLLTTEHLTVGYKRNDLATDVNLTLTEGLTALIGPNGVGKSTLIKTLTGILKAKEGVVKLKDRNIREFSKKSLAREIAVVYTESGLAGGLRLHEYVSLGRYPYTGISGKLSSEDRDIIHDTLEVVGISHKSHSFVAELSDGERQKGMIAKALVQKTPLIIMDEPFTYLDVASRLEILSIMRTLTSGTGRAILFSTHEVTESLDFSDKIWIFKNRTIVEGSPDFLIDQGELGTLFESKNIYFDKTTRQFRIADKQ